MTKLKSLFFAGCLLIHGFCYAQDPVFTWAKNMGSMGFNSGSFIVADGSGNVYTGGAFDGTGDFDPGPGIYNLSSTATATNAQNFFISKLDASGNFLWAKSFPNNDYEQLQSLDVDEAGNLYLAGTFYSTVDFDPGVGIFNMTSAGYSDYFILKLDTHGNFKWAKQIGNFNGEFSLSLAVGHTGVYIAGNLVGVVDVDPGSAIYNLISLTGSPDFFVEKLDTSGNLIWARQMGDSLQDISERIFVDSAENIYIAGIFLGTTDFDPGPGTHNLTSDGPYQDIFVLKVDSSFNFLWAGSLRGPEWENAASIAVSTSGDVYVTGSMRATVDFDPGPGTYNLTAIGLTDIFICKLNSSGNFEWAKQIGNDQYEGSANLFIDVTGNIYVTGVFSGTADFDPGPGVYNLVSEGNNPFTDIFLCKLNPSGNLVWAKRLGASGGDSGLGIFVDPAFNVYATGGYENSVDFDPGPGIYNLPAPAFRNIYVLKMAQQTVIPLSLLDFSATLKSSHEVQLQWQTVRGQNTEKFIIERSTNEGYFSSIGTKGTPDNIASTNNYLFTDKRPLPGRNFYRLRMIDNDGSFTYSKIESIKISNTKLHIYPNPAKEILHITLYGENTSAMLQIIDAAGKIMKQVTLKFNGHVSFAINISAFPPGKYHLLLQTGNAVEVSEFLKH